MEHRRRESPTERPVEAVAVGAVHDAADDGDTQGTTKLTARPHTSKKKKVAKAAAASAVAVGAVMVAKRSMSKDEDEFEYTP